ncbi:MAG: 30S ribosomal protein S2 [Chloroflexi bacterium]|nr:30S ribosomal protein S2 [Chloroflexota bacterium]
MAVVSLKALLETGVHFGHRTRKWNPLMKPYIFTERNGIHIIDLQQTVAALWRVHSLVRDTVSKSGTVLFVGTKRQAQESIESEALRCEMPYVNQRWLGGTLTNWKTIRERIQELKRLEERRGKGEFEKLIKKEGLLLERKIERLTTRLGGIRDMSRLPELLFVVDVRREETAIHEANILAIPVIAVVDTNCNPSGVDYVIPANDDAIRAIKLLTARVADAVVEGRLLRKDEEQVEAAPGAGFVEPEMDEADLLGASTLAKLDSGELHFEDQGDLSKAMTASEAVEAAQLAAASEGELKSEGEA